MKNPIRILTLGLLLVAGLVSCKKTTKSFMPNPTGKAGEVMIVMSESLWKGAAGDTLKAIFSEDQVGLPQSEPVMDVFNIPHSALTSMFKTNRSILDVRVSRDVTQTKLSVKKGMWAKDQAYMKMEAPSESELIDLIQENRTKILAYFVSGERERILNVIKRKPEKDIFNFLKKKKNFTLAFPSGYNINKKKDDFIWISKETPKTSQGMFIYTFEYKSQNNFSKEYLLHKRDSLLKADVPGPTAGSYMTTELNFPPTYRQFTFQKNYAVEMRGLWKVEKDFMGGPFLNISFLDEKNNRIICLDGYVYNPNQDKRELLRELEVIMYSFTPVNAK